MINPYLENNSNNIKSIINKNINNEISDGKLVQKNDKVLILDSLLVNQIITLISNIKYKSKNSLIKSSTRFNLLTGTFNFSSCLIIISSIVVLSLI